MTNILSCKTVSNKERILSADSNYIWHLCPLLDTALDRKLRFHGFNLQSSKKNVTITQQNKCHWFIKLLVHCHIWDFYYFAY